MFIRSGVWVFLQKKNSRAAVIANYDRLSRWYDWLSEPSERKYRRIGLQILNPRAGERILEIGSGTGHALLTLAQAVGDSGQVVGVDLSAGMIQVTRQRLAASPGRCVSVCRADGLYLPFKSHSMHAVFMSFTLELFPAEEILLLLAECRRVLAHGGRMALVALAKTERPGMMSQVYNWAHDHYPQWIDCRPIEVQQALRKSDFRLLHAGLYHLWGLPVEVVLCQPEFT
jgi:demethylmenaquinone methyltransferase/2-methoxy-6-polyprenyl-1,4-benzoquinol methylase